MKMQVIVFDAAKVLSGLLVSKIRLDYTRENMFVDYEVHCNDHVTITLAVHEFV
jgi:hypothetical protein